MALLLLQQPAVIRASVAHAPYGPSMSLLSYQTAFRCIACPFCDSETARQVRSGIMSADAGYHLMASIAPFAVLAVFLVAIYLEPAKPRDDCELSENRSGES